MKRNNGITLIALVITIIVLLILAGVAIAMLSGENGILKRATEAKRQTEQSQKDESGNLKDMEYLINKNTDKIQWKYKKDSEGRNTIVTNGIYDLPIGTYINYNAAAKDAEEKTIEEKTETSNAGGPTTTEYYKASEQTVEEGNGAKNQTFSNKAKTNGWRVLGVDETTGELLIISADPVKTNTNTDFYIQGIAGWLYGEQELNKVCSVFGSGYGATGARSVNIDDINKITGYNPNNVGKYDPEQNGTGTKYKVGQVTEYGNKVTYTWTSTANQISWKGSNNKNGTGSNTDYEKYGFNWYDIESKTWKNSMQNTTTPTEIATLTSNDYYYYPSSLYTSTETGDGLKTTSEEYKTLFMNKAESKVNYWLASSVVYTCSDYALLGMRRVRSAGGVDSRYLYCSYGDLGYDMSHGVRPVVSLKSDIQLKEEANGIYDLK